MNFSLPGLKLMVEGGAKEAHKVLLGKFLEIAIYFFPTVGVDFAAFLAVGKLPSKRFQG